jgi:hypothetical protein
MSDYELSPGTTPTTSRRRHRLLDETPPEEGEEHVHVCIRVRPFNRRELEIMRQSGESTLRSVVEMPEGLGGKVVFWEKVGDSPEYRRVEEFKYTKTFWSIPEEQQAHPFAPVTQEDVFNEVGASIIKYAFAGFNNCVFAYGQTGSGKTHSMMGDFTTEKGEFTGDPGLIPRLCKALFEALHEKAENAEEGIESSYDIRLSAIEIYNEQVRDLFWQSSPGRTKSTVLKVRMHPVEGAFVDQLTILNPKNWQECIKLIGQGVSERTVAATLMNDESSRSHSLFQIKVTHTETVAVRSDNDEDRYLKPVTSKRVAKINLVDLAGSERLKKSGAQGQQLKEAAGINQSLSTLKKVIDALVSNSKEPNPKKHLLIPFRESTLTLLLSDSIGGNSKTTMIACVSPHFDNQEETLLTLRYANRTGAIVNNARVNEDSAAKQALALKHQINELQRRLTEGPVNEEAEDLLDQIEVGQLALQELNEAARRAEQQAEAVRQLSRKEKEARISSAFFSTMKMVMLQQQKEQMEASALEMEGRINQYNEEANKLRLEMAEQEQKEREKTKAIEKMRIDHQKHFEVVVEQEQHAKKLDRENKESVERMEKEMRLRYAQKILNVYRLKKLSQQLQEDLERVQEEKDAKLTNVIVEAAEQYELQVRQFADAETLVHQQTTRSEKEIGTCLRMREEAEAKGHLMMKELQGLERAHLSRINIIEVEWKAKYEAMKRHYEERIATMDEEFYSETKKWDERVDDEAYAVSFDQKQAVSMLEGQLRAKEREWNGKIADVVEKQAQRIDDEIKKALRTHALNAAAKRRTYEDRMGELVHTLQRTEAMEREHEESIAYIERVIAPLVHLHDMLNAKGPRTPSNEYLALKHSISKYQDEYRSVKPLVKSPDDNANTSVPSLSLGANMKSISAGREASPKTPAQTSPTAAPKTPPSSNRKPSVALFCSPLPTSSARRTSLPRKL